MTVINQISCPYCKATNSIKTSGEKFSCEACGSIIDKTIFNISKENNQNICNPKSDITLGLKGKIDNQDIEITGYILYESKDEEGVWQWEEWFAPSNEGYCWIHYDISEQTYTFFKQIEPKYPINTNEIRNEGIIWLSREERFTVKEIGSAKIICLAGEIPWKANVGDEIKYADGYSVYNLYSVEWSENEIEVYKGRTINKKELFASLQMKEKLEELIKKEQNALNWNLVERFLVIAMAISFIFGILSLFSGNVIYSEKITFCPESSIEITAPSFLYQPYQNSSLCKETKFPIGPIHFKKPNKVYKVEIISLTASRTNWLRLDINLLDEYKQPISGLEGDFWMEDWREEGESGTDIKNKASKIFRLTKTGQYYLDMDVDKQNQNNEIDIFTIKIYENIILARYFFIFSGVLFLIIGLRNGLIESLKEEFMED